MWHPRRPSLGIRLVYESAKRHLLRHALFGRVQQQGSKYNSAGPKRRGRSWRLFGQSLLAVLNFIYQPGQAGNSPKSGQQCPESGRPGPGKLCIFVGHVDRLVGPGTGRQKGARPHINIENGSGNHSTHDKFFSIFDFVNPNGLFSYLREIQ